MCGNFKRSRTLGIALASVLLLAGCSKKQSSVTGPTETIPNAVNIYMDSTRQIIRGFGGVNMPGWIPDMTSEQVQEAFGTGPGQIGLSILRIRVSYDSSQFDLEVPTAKLAYSLGAVVFASPWTPPAWMKSSDNIVGGILNTSAYAPYAAHLKAFADYMSSNGVPLYAVSVQNEPDASVSYESCSWNATQLLNFVKNNAPTIGTKIIAPESENFNHALSDPMLNDPAAAVNVSIIGGHLYGGGLTSYPLAVNKGKEVWMTEHLSTDTTWRAVYITAEEIDDCMKAGMNAYVWWYIRRFYGLIDENSNVTKRGYVMSQYARFVRPGFYRVSANAIPQARVFVSAFKNGSRTVIVAINDAASVNQTFVIWNGSATNFTPYVTSISKNCLQESDITVSNGSFTATLDSSSVTTFVSN